MYASIAENDHRRSFNNRVQRKIIRQNKTQALFKGQKAYRLGNKVGTKLLQFFKTSVLVLKARKADKRRAELSIPKHIFL